ncbi:hypothetical protein UB32_16965, partial [Mesobacillus subterraneus]
GLGFLSVGSNKKNIWDSCRESGGTRFLSLRPFSSYSVISHECSFRKQGVGGIGLLKLAF